MNSKSSPQPPHICAGKAWFLKQPFPRPRAVREAYGTGYTLLVYVCLHDFEYLKRQRQLICGNDCHYKLVKSISIVKTYRYYTLQLYILFGLPFRNYQEFTHKFNPKGGDDYFYKDMVCTFMEKESFEANDKNEENL